MTDLHIMTDNVKLTGHVASIHQEGSGFEDFDSDTEIPRVSDFLASSVLFFQV